MDQDTLVTDMKKLAEMLEQNEGPLALFMLVAPDAETNDAWNVIVSAPGLDSVSIGKAVHRVADSLRQTIRKSEWHRILRTTVLRTDDPFVRALNSMFQAEHSVLNLQGYNISGIEIPKAVLLESKRVAA